MIEIKIPKEINKYEAKFIGPFTLRQSIALIVALPLCVLIYNLLSPYVPLEVIFFALLIPGGAAYLFGWSNFYGMKIETFIKSVFVSAFLAPSKRKYHTENYYSIIAKEIIEEERAKEREQNKKQKKYKRSSEAIK